MTGNASGRARWASSRWQLCVACSIVSLPAATPSLAQDAPAPITPTPTPAPAPADDDIEGPRIVVIGQRVIVASLQDVEPEQTYDEDRVQSYDVSTVGELLEQIHLENGDAEPSVLVNGQPVRNLGDIADLPVEAIQSIEALPRGSAQRVGGGAGQRAYNVVLKPSVKSATLTGSYQWATEGGWAQTRGEVLLNYIKGQDRLGVTLRASESDALFESERGSFIPRDEPIPYSALGNIVPAAGTQIDPVLSALAGQLVSRVPVAAGVLHPTLASFVGGANQISPSNQGRYRSLRGASEPYELSIAGNKTITDQLSISFNGRLSWSNNTNFSGLPAARFLIPATNSFTPFSTSVYLALNDPNRRLRNVSDTFNASVSSTLNANVGDWHGTLVNRYDRREREFTSQFTALLSAAAATVGPTVNPFDGSLAAQIPVGVRFSESVNEAAQVDANADGPLFDLWAGPMLARLGLGAGWVSLDADGTSGPRRFRRHEYSAEAGVTIPLTRSDGFLSPLGDLELALDFGVVELGDYGTLEHHSAALNWQPTPWLHLVASEVEDEQPISAELLAAPDVITPNVAYFDPLTGQTVDVTTIYGGVGNLAPQSLRTRTLSATANPLRKYNLQLNADYVVTDLENQIGSLPPPNSAVVAAFPDRFVRDANGTLVLVDNRSVNFARQHTESLRLGAGVNVPIVAAVNIPANRETGAARRRVPAITLQLNVSHTFLLEGTTVIREGLPTINLLKGGAIGLGGSQAETTDVTAALTRGPSGVRFNMRRIGRTSLIVGSLAAPDLLTFEPVATVEVKAFLDLGQVFPTSKAAKETRLSVVFQNILNERQRVRNTLGLTPQAYQPLYRDAIGRTAMVELRKVF